MPRTASKAQDVPSSEQPRRRGRKRTPIEERPQPLWTEWDDPDDFAEALELHMQRHGDSAYRLQKALAANGPTVNVTTLRMWRIGSKAPSDAPSLRVLEEIEARYGLPPGYFRAKLPPTGRAIKNHRLPGLTVAERRRLTWHLPDDFDCLPHAKREEILDWVRTVVVSGSTEYRRYQAAAMRQRFAVRFSGFCGDLPMEVDDEPEDDASRDEPDAELTAGTVPATPALEQEMAGLLAFKTAALTSRGLQRSGVWGSETASQKVEHLGLMFGALAAAPSGDVTGAGVPLNRLTFGLLAFPAVWDWYLQWRETRRGFYTQWEGEMLLLGAALTRRETGWIRQTPNLAQRLKPIPGFVSQAEIDLARADWDAVCDEIHRHVLHRAKEVARISRVHRDPFEPVLAILEADSPLGVRPQDKKGDGKWARPKQLLLIPHRFAIAMQDKGWLLRNDNVWVKPNPIPDQVRDRCSISHEYVFHLTKSRWYYFDKNAVGRPTEGGSVLPPLDTWEVPTSRGAKKHKASFSEELVRIPILTTTPARGVVLDPFGGSGTSLMYARKHGFRSIGIDVSTEYCELMVDRITGQFDGDAED